MQLGNNTHAIKDYINVEFCHLTLLGCCKLYEIKKLINTELQHLAQLSSH